MTPKPPHIRTDQSVSTMVSVAIHAILEFGYLRLTQSQHLRPRQQGTPPRLEETDSEDLQPSGIAGLDTFTITRSPRSRPQTT